MSDKRLRKVRDLIGHAGGFSLTELLATMLILVLVGTLVAVGIPSAQRAYENVMNASNADVYLSTTTGRLREVLGEADPNGVTPGSGETLITFTSKKTGRQVSILSASDGVPGIYVQEAQLDPVVDGVTTYAPPEPSLLVPAAVGVGAGSVRFVAQVDRIDYENGLFTVRSISVEDVNRLEEDAAYATRDELVVRPIAAS